MIQIHKVNSPDDKEKYIDAFDPENQTWLVADLMSKKRYQETFLKKNVLLEGHSVLRMSEFWTNLYKLSSLKYRCISRFLAQMKIQQKLKELNIQQPGAAKVILNYIDQFLPVISHPHGSERMKEWLKGNVFASERWGSWFNYSSRFFNQLKGENSIISSWMPALLLYEVNVESLWKRSLIIDVGPYLHEVEAELLIQMSRFINVQLFMPDPSWGAEYQGEVLQSYSIIHQNQHSKEPVREVSEGLDRSPTHSFPVINKDFSKENIEGLDNNLKSGLGVHQRQVQSSKRSHHALWQTQRFECALSEVKLTISQVRSWLAAGVPYEHIAIMAPDIGYYWPILKIYSDVEGLILKRRRASALLSFPQIHHWLSQIEIRIRKYDFSYIEMASYYKETPLERRYSDFKKKYLNLYDRRELAGCIHDKKDVFIELNKKIKFKEFLIWALSLSKNIPFELLEKQLQKMIGDVSEQDQFYPVEWLNYLENSLSFSEKEMSNESIEGIPICDIASGERIGASHIILMGLSESPLRTSRKTAVLHDDIKKIGHQIGFLVPLSDMLDLEFQVRWIVESKNIKEVYFNFSETDFEGKILNPSYLWQKICFEDISKKQSASLDLEPKDYQDLPLGSRSTTAGVEGLSSHCAVSVLGKEQNSKGHQNSLGRTVLDFQQEMFRDFMQLKNMKNLDQGFFNESRDLKEKIESSNYCRIDDGFQYSLSPSSLQDFKKCPFIFSAKKMYGLKSDSKWDIDLDPINRGSLVHKLFSRLLEKLNHQWSNKDIFEVIEECRKNIKFPVKSSSVWNWQRKRYLNIAKDFINFERAWRKEYTDLTTEKGEVHVEGYIDSKTGEFLKSQKQAAILFKGSIDRVDKNKKGECVVIDYKFSKSSYRQWKSWEKHNEWQLMFYSMAVEAGLAETDAQSVLGAVYFFVHPLLRRDYGFLNKEKTGGLFPDERMKKEIYEVLKQKNKGMDYSKRESEYINEEELLVCQSQFKNYLVSTIAEINRGDFTPKPEKIADCDKCEWRNICRAPHLN